MDQSNSRYHDPCDARRSLSILHFAPLRLYAYCTESTVVSLDPSGTCHAVGKSQVELAPLLGLLHHNSQGAHALGMKPGVPCSRYA